MEARRHYKYNQDSGGSPDSFSTNFAGHPFSSPTIFQSYGQTRFGRATPCLQTPGKSSRSSSPSDSTCRSLMFSITPSGTPGRTPTQMQMCSPSAEKTQATDNTSPPKPLCLFDSSDESDHQQDFVKSPPLSPPPPVKKHKIVQSTLDSYFPSRKPLSNVSNRPCFLGGYKRFSQKKVRRFSQKKVRMQNQMNSDDDILDLQSDKENRCIQSQSSKISSSPSKPKLPAKHPKTPPRLSKPQHIFDSPPYCMNISDRTNFQITPEDIMFPDDSSPHSDPPSMTRSISVDSAVLCEMQRNYTPKLAVVNEQDGMDFEESLSQPTPVRSFSEGVSTPKLCNRKTSMTDDGSPNLDVPTTLPVITYSKGIPRIEPETIVALLQHEYQNDFDKFCLIDCRYPYEYEGGHIKGAINLNLKKQVEAFYNANKNTESNICIIFHCEFSQNRGPKLASAFRKLDREHHAYPRLTFPELYILDGGYKNFFSASETHCIPQSYISMWDDSYIDENKRCTTEFRESWKKNKNKTRRSRMSARSRTKSSSSSCDLSSVFHYR